VLNEDIKWVSFHGGFDFAYLVRMLCGTDLPEDDVGFSNLLNIYFPCFYDIKYMTKEIESLKSGSLSKIAGDLRVNFFSFSSVYIFYRLEESVPSIKQAVMLYSLFPHMLNSRQHT